jgi:hypothetical protein
VLVARKLPDDRPFPTRSGSWSSATWSVEVGLEIEDWALVVNEAIDCIGRVDKVHELATGFAQVSVDEPHIPADSPFAKADDEVLAVARGTGTDKPVGMIGAFINEHVVALRRAQWLGIAWYFSPGFGSG